MQDLQLVHTEEHQESDDVAVIAEPPVPEVSEEGEWEAEETAKEVRSPPPPSMPRIEEEEEDSG